jgi:hypothetical protein
MKLEEVGCHSMEWIHLAWDGDKRWYLRRGQYLSGFHERWAIYSAFFPATLYFCFLEIVRYSKTTRLGNVSASVQLDVKTGTDPVPTTLRSFFKEHHTMKKSRKSAVLREIS